MAAVMPMVSVMMMPAPVVMPMTVMAVMPMPAVMAVSSVVTDLDDALVHQLGQPDSRAEVGCFGWTWSSHEESEAESQSEYDLPEHVFLLRQGALQAHASERVIEGSVSAPPWTPLSAW